MSRETFVRECVVAQRLPKIGSTDSEIMSCLEACGKLSATERRYERDAKKRRLDYKYIEGFTSCSKELFRCTEMANDGHPASVSIVSLLDCSEGRPAEKTTR